MSPGVVLLAAAVTMSAPDADAPCGRSGRPWVAITGSAVEIADVVALMRAELEARHIDVCGDASARPTPALATVDVSAAVDGAAIAVEVRDALTAKRIVRDVALGAVPPDGRALTLALAAEELLRASWAELALTTAPPPPAPVPLAVTRIVEEARPAPGERTALTPEPPSPWVAFSTMAAFEVGAGGILYGGDVRVAIPAGQRIAAVARVGFREGPVTSGPDGHVYTWLVLGGLGGVVRTTPQSSRYALDVLGRVDLGSVNYVPVPNAGATGHSRSALTGLASAGLDAWVALATSVRFVTELLVEVPLRPVRANDAEQRVTGVDGVGGAVGVGLSVVF